MTDPYRIQPKVKTKVSSSGGFYRYPRETRTVQSKGLPKQINTIMTKDYKNNAQAILERMKKIREMATSQSSLYEVDIESQRTKLKPLRQELVEVPSLASLYAPLVLKSAEDLKAESEQKSRGRGAQTENLPIYKKEFPEYKDYSNWVSSNVDPFIKELKDLLKKQRPADIEQYVIAFCCAKQLNQSHPVTVEYVEPIPPETPRNKSEPIINIVDQQKKRSTTEIDINIDQDQQEPENG